MTVHQQAEGNVNWVSSLFSQTTRSGNKMVAHQHQVEGNMNWVIFCQLKQIRDSKKVAVLLKADGNTNSVSEIYALTMSVRINRKT